MCYSFDSKRLNKNLSSMEGKNTLLFGLLVIDRMLPNFYAFAIDSATSNAYTLDRALFKAWSYLASDELEDCLKVSQNDCERLIPESEEFASLYTSAASDVAVAVVNVLEFLETHDVSLIVEVAKLAIDSVHMHIQSITNVDVIGENVMNMIEKHPKMQAELASQSNDLSFVKTLNFLDVTAYAKSKLYIARIK